MSTPLGPDKTLLWPDFRRSPAFFFDRNGVERRGYHQFGWEDGMATEEDLEMGMEPVAFRPVDRGGAVEHFLGLVGGTPSLKSRIEARVDQVIQKLQIDDGREEQLWVCQSRYIGPLAGHAGLGVVRRGELLRYESIVDY